MASALDYIDWRGDLSFDAAPVNEIDEYIFACIGKPDFTGIIPADEDSVTVKQAVSGYFRKYPDADKLGLIASARTLPMLKKLAVSDRYKDIAVSGFINRVSPEITEQFSALTVRADGVNYVSFRGTDDTLIGWKENCEIAVFESVPAQRDALEYLIWASSAYDGPLVVCGHSKGGNLAVYAACLAPEEIQDRIIEVISYDGPGFQEEFFLNEGYARMESRITTYVPYKSVVGMLLNQAGRLDVIQSETSGVVGHDGLTWDVDRTTFIHAPELSNMSKVFRSSMAETLSDMDAGDRFEVVNEIFDVLSSTGAFNLSDFSENTFKQALEMAGHLRKATDVRGFLAKFIDKSFKHAKTSLGSRIEELLPRAEE